VRRRGKQDRLSYEITILSVSPYLTRDACREQMLFQCSLIRSAVRMPNIMVKFGGLNSHSWWLVDKQYI